MISITCYCSNETRDGKNTYVLLDSDIRLPTQFCAAAATSALSPIAASPLRPGTPAGGGKPALVRRPKEPKSSVSILGDGLVSWGASAFFTSRDRRRNDRSDAKGDRGVAGVAGTDGGGDRMADFVSASTSGSTLDVELCDSRVLVVVLVLVLATVLALGLGACAAIRFAAAPRGAAL